MLTLRLPRRAAQDRPDPRRVTLALVGLTLILTLLSLGTGAAGLSLADMARAIAGDGLDRRAAVILYDIRLPRLGMGLLVGAALAVSVALMRQMLIRNSAAATPRDAHETESLAVFYTSQADGREGVKAFNEKRTAQFTGKASQMPPFFPWYENK